MEVTPADTRGSHTYEGFTGLKLPELHESVFERRPNGNELYRTAGHGRIMTRMGPLKKPGGLRPTAVSRDRPGRREERKYQSPEGRITRSITWITPLVARVLTSVTVDSPFRSTDAPLVEMPMASP